MNILITGAKGFVGKNLYYALKNIKDGKDRTHTGLEINNIYTYDLGSTEEELYKACQKADFVFNLAGVNRPKEQSEFMKGNLGFASKLLEYMKKHKNCCPIMLSSSIQASLTGRFANSQYGKSKKACEDLFFNYATETGSKVFVYRFPNLFGKWCKPDYNSVVATFCHNLSRDLPIQINDPNTKLELVYIDDLIEEMILALQNNEHHCEFDGLVTLASEKGSYCYVPISHIATLGEIVKLLEQFKKQPETMLIPEIANNSFAKKLYSTYLSYLPPNKISFPIKSNTDDRGSFAELFHSLKNGQISINISKPGATKGQHWHQSKWEIFIVVSGQGLIQLRKIDSDEIIDFEVSGEKLEAVHMLPGYTHSIINLSKTENLVTIMYANENFDPQKPDTFHEEV